MLNLRDRVPQSLIYGGGFLIVMAAIILGMFQFGLLFIEWYVENAESPSETWEMAYLIGVLVALLIALLLDKLFRSQFGWWYIYFESWLNTLHYPMVEEDDSSEGSE